LKVEILTLFPKFFDSVFDQSILSRARASGALEISVHDLRRFTTDRHQQADDYLYGGGPGMLMKPEPIFRAFEQLVAGVKPRPLVVYPSAQGKRFTQAAAAELSQQQHLVFLCGHYKGVDQRVVERWVDLEYSLGDYVITGGEIATAAMVDAAVRLIPGVLGDAGSAAGDSFQGDRLDCAHYTRPERFEGMDVPGVLLTGNHKQIECWRRMNSGFLTQTRRPDILKKQ